MAKKARVVEEKNELRKNKFVKPMIVVAIVLMLAYIGFGFYSGIIGGRGLTGNTIADNLNPTKECKKVQVPYQDIEYYTETVPYQEDINLNYNHQQVSGEGCSDFGNYKECYYVKIDNLDNAGGTFTLNCNFKTVDRNLQDSQTQFVQSGESKTFRCVADVNLGEDVRMTYSVTPGTKTVTKYKDVQRTRSVTKYRTETQCS